MNLVAVTVVYALRERATEIALQLPAGATVTEALVRSAISARHPEIDIAHCPVGIFGKIVADPEVRPVHAGDRIEIYRPLLVDPKEVRRLRAAKAAEAKARNQ